MWILLVTSLIITIIINEHIFKTLLITRRAYFYVWNYLRQNFQLKKFLLSCNFLIGQISDFFVWMIHFHDELILFVPQTSNVNIYYGRHFTFWFIKHCLIVKQYDDLSEKIIKKGSLRDKCFNSFIHHIYLRIKQIIFWLNHE